MASLQLAIFNNSTKAEAYALTLHGINTEIKVDGPFTSVTINNATVTPPKNLMDTSDGTYFIVSSKIP